MSDCSPIELSGATLTIDQLVACVDDPSVTVALSERSVAAMADGERFLRDRLTSEVIYGVNTGFGPMAWCVLGSAQLIELQYNLVRSHATGMGEPLSPRLVLAAMIARLNTLARGVSGTSPELGRTLEAFINCRITPVVPEHGAVGTSGDLVQLAHVALALIGEGEVHFEGTRMETATALRRLEISPHRLRPKEGLSLINGTAAMTGIAALLCADAERLLDLAIRTAAWSLEIMRAFDDGISEGLHELRPHPGQRQVARLLREHTNGSSRLRDRRTFFAGQHIDDDGYRMPEIVQEVYSIRCVPQILGPVYDTLHMVKTRVETELNSVTDNPILVWDTQQWAHGGNFHGDYIAASVDQLKMVIVKLTMLSERRVNYFCHAKLNGKFPPFLNVGTLGFNLGLQALQFVATSTTALSQTLAFPQYVHSIPTNGDNQDVVSMGTDAGLVAKKVIENGFVVLAIEAVALAQAVDCLGIASELSYAAREFYDVVRQHVARVDRDRYMAPELDRLTTRLRTLSLPIVSPASLDSAMGPTS